MVTCHNNDQLAFEGVHDSRNRFFVKPVGSFLLIPIAEYEMSSSNREHQTAGCGEVLLEGDTRSNAFSTIELFCFTSYIMKGQYYVEFYKYSIVRS